MTDPSTSPRITRKHLTRLREIYRSSGWPCRDPLEVDLLVGGSVQAERDDQGRETLHLTPAGLQALANAHATNRANRSAHDELVMQVAQRMQQEGRIAWTQLALRAQVDGAWTQAIPDVFSIRHTTVEAYLEPVVHEIKVSRADLLGDLKRPEKRAAYLAMASQVYYVLGRNAKGQSIADADEVPTECGVMVATSSGLELVRVAPKQPFTGLRFDVWMALAKTAALSPSDDGAQMAL
ncbi:MAG TPA: hypothetical protein VFW93_07190 [Aquabacterium sp.]|uniref:hypothetical protein n=1 Tax=Aquabacterium sp. TaxID=1872578 RepID=UPI002E31340E|nr:hypothetical protein [Aquabacterium sp.]HEX5355984.1 hypothetical protein [Aquabacterium sp.]